MKTIKLWAIDFWDWYTFLPLKVKIASGIVLLLFALWVVT